ncbi:MAG TPA: DUF3419 family protein [Phycisphaerae bacterium]|nr:DUF3419 family protein [Phycisphaerae bacterium]
MSPAVACAEKCWQKGRLDGGSEAARLIFGHMFEDPAIEAQVFDARARVFAIASAGCIALALARRGCAVTAVDVNPAQIAYVRQRSAGGPTRDGQVDRWMRRGRRLLPLLGWPRQRVMDFLNLANLALQRRIWSAQSSTLRWRGALRLLLDPRMLRRRYARGLLAAVPPRFDRVIQQRLLRGFGTHANRTNPFAWRLLRGTPLLPVEPPAARLANLLVADAVTFLQNCRPGSFDAFTLSNILDGASDTYAVDLRAAVGRAATPRAIVIARSFGLPRSAGEEQWARRDRSLLWGAITVQAAGRWARGSAQLVRRTARTALEAKP